MTSVVLADSLPATNALGTASALVVFSECCCVAVLAILCGVYLLHVGVSKVCLQSEDYRIKTLWTCRKKDVIVSSFI